MYSVFSLCACIQEKLALLLCHLLVKTASVVESLWVMVMIRIIVNNYNNIP